MEQIDLANMNFFIAMLAAVFYGALSFISPCVLPLVPSYLGYMSGAAVQKGTMQGPRRIILFHALAFVIGFTVIFVMIFGIGSEILDRIFGYTYHTLLQVIGGAFMIVFGLHFLG